MSPRSLPHVLCALWCACGLTSGCFNIPELVPAGGGGVGGTGAGGDAGGSGGSAGSGGSGGFPAGASVCPTLEDEAGAQLLEGTLMGAIDVSGPALLRGLVRVGPNATLTIASGSCIYAEPDAMLLVQASGAIEAIGTAESPIVFTSVRVGRDPGAAPGDWKGVVLLGSTATRSTVEAGNALDWPGTTVPYGSDDVSDDSHDAGTVRFVRIEYGGTADHGGLSLGGVGANTEVDHIHVFRPPASCYAVVGGRIDLERLLCFAPGPSGDGVRISDGFRGSGLGIAVLGLPETDPAGHGIRALDDETTVMSPAYAGFFSNLTLCGVAGSGATSFGLKLGDESDARFTKTIASGFDAGFDVESTQPPAEVQILVQCSMFDNAAADVGLDTRDDDLGFDEDGEFAGAECNSVDPTGLSCTSWETMAPSSPLSPVGAGCDCALPGGMIPASFASTDYVGAFENDGAGLWATGPFAEL